MSCCIAGLNWAQNPLALDWTWLDWTGLECSGGDESVVPTVPAGNRKWSGDQGSAGMEGFSGHWPSLLSCRERSSVSLRDSLAEHVFSLRILYTLTDKYKMPELARTSAIWFHMNDVSSWVDDSDFISCFIAFHLLSLFASYKFTYLKSACVTATHLIDRIQLIKHFYLVLKYGWIPLQIKFLQTAQKGNILKTMATRRYNYVIHAHIYTSMYI